MTPRHGEMKTPKVTSQNYSVRKYSWHCKAQSIRGKTSLGSEPEVTFCLWRKIQKLAAFLIVFLGAHLCQILKEINMTSLVSFAFLVHVLM